MSTEIDYVLGTHQEEIDRLGLQHRVWQPLMLDAWIRAGITLGTRFVDFGAGPGYAALDAAAIVGAQGEVLAIERSQHFLTFAKRQAARAGVSCLRFLAADLDVAEIEAFGFDLAWCRWVACFVASPERLLQCIGDSLRVGGKAVLHEYQNYATWQFIPQSERMTEFVREVMASWRAAGGEPDIVNRLLPAMEPAGLRILHVRPLISTIGPAHFTWNWPASFVASGSQRLAQLGRISQDLAREIQSEFRTLEKNPRTVMVTPLVVEITAEKI